MIHIGATLILNGVHGNINSFLRLRLFGHSNIIVLIMGFIGSRLVSVNECSSFVQRSTHVIAIVFFYIIVVFSNVGLFENVLISFFSVNKFLFLLKLEVMFFLVRLVKRLVLRVIQVSQRLL